LTNSSGGTWLICNKVWFCGYATQLLPSEYGQFAGDCHSSK